MSTNRHLCFIFLYMAIVPQFSNTRAQNTEDGKLEAFYHDHLEETLRLRPVTASFLGDHRYDPLLDDVSPDGRALWDAQNRATLSDLPKAVNYQKLSRAAQVDYEILKHDLELDLWMTKNFKPFEEDPRSYGSYITGCVYTLLAKSTLPLETNVRNSIARMEKIPGVIEIAKRTLTRPAKSILETAILQNRGAISFYEKGIYELAGKTKQRAELQAAAAPIISALEDYQAFLENDLMTRSTSEWRLGRAKFARKFKRVLDANLTADQSAAYASEEYARVKREMYVLSRQLWSHYFPENVLPPDDENGRQETIATVIEAISQEHGEPEELLGDAQATVGQIKDFIRKRKVLTLPDPDTCQIVEMPEFRRGNSLAYLDSAPPFDPEGATYYAVSPPPSDWGEEQTRSFLEEYNSHMLQILTIHEAYPGHYVQLEYANRNPSLIRRVIGSGVYIEGWAVYTEQMMLDEGYGDQDLRLRMMQLKFYLRAVVNAILDYKLHAAGMSDEEALELMIEGAFQSEGEARLKLIRAKQSSTQLSTYFVGRMAHYQLRQSIQREMGDAFDLGAYHEAVLNEGSIPVKYLPELVRAQMIPGK